MNQSFIDLLKLQGEETSEVKKMIIAKHFILLPFRKKQKLAAEAEICFQKDKQILRNNFITIINKKK